MSKTNYMQIDELKKEEMFVLCAPDGSIQLTTLAPDYAMCLAITRMLGEKGIGKPLHIMFEEGFQVLPVAVTITQAGDANKAFNDFKKSAKKR